MTTTTDHRAERPADDFTLHPARGRFNAGFFRLVGPYLEWHLRPHKRRVFAELPTQVVELGPGVGANLRHLPAGTSLVAIEPNRHMHARLRAAAAKHPVDLDVRQRSAADTGLAEHSVDAVISSLVLCSVSDPEAVLAEVRRVLRPGGTFHFVEHVVAPPRSITRTAQRLVRRPWAWVFEGCSCERDLEDAVRRAGFADVDIVRYRVHTPFLPFNTQIAGRATASASG